MSNAYVIFGLHFGDEGKGSIIDFLSREKPNPTIIKLGGPQGAHNVVTPYGKHHTFSQLGSGMFVEGVETYLSRHMLVQPESLMDEQEMFEEKVGRSIVKDIFIDDNCIVVTPYHRIDNIDYAIRNQISTCGVGVGSAIHDLKNDGFAIRVRDLSDQSTIKDKLKFFKNRSYYNKIDRENLIKSYQEFYSRYNIYKSEELNKYFKEKRTFIFECSQGALLGDFIGFRPHISPTFMLRFAHRLAGQYFYPVIIGTTRCYSHRHGKGPLPSEDILKMNLPEHHNKNNRFQGSFRTGIFDPILFSYVLRHYSIDYLAVTHLDRFPGSFPQVNSYIYEGDNYNDVINQGIFRFKKGTKEIIRFNGMISRRGQPYINNIKPFIHKYNDYMIEDSEEFLEYIQSNFKPVAIASYGQKASDKKWLKNV